MMTARELKEWAATIADDNGVAIDDGGLCLVEVEDDGEGGVRQTEAYLEVGGLPLSEPLFEYEVEVRFRAEAGSGDVYGTERHKVRLRGEDREQDAEREAIRLSDESVHADPRIDYVREYDVLGSEEVEDDGDEGDEDEGETDWGRT